MFPKGLNTSTITHNETTLTSACVVWINVHYSIMNRLLDLRAFLKSKEVKYSTLGNRGA